MLRIHSNSGFEINRYTRFLAPICFMTERRNLLVEPLLLNAWRGEVAQFPS